MTGIIILISILPLVLFFYFWIERGHLYLPSTLRAAKWVGIKRILKGELLHGLLYGRWIPQYLNFISKLAPHLGPRGRKWLENTYHGKVLTPDLAKTIVTLDIDVPMQDLGEKIIPYPRARDIVLNASPDIAVTNCGCKTMRDEPCKLFEPPYQVCMLIGKPLTDFLLEHHPKTARRITRDEALRILEEVHKQGGVHSGWFKDCIRDQFYAICNCCSCCCIGFESMRLGIKQIISSGYVARVAENECKGCKTCEDICPIGASEVNEKAVVNWGKCLGCGVCVSKCPNNARSLVLDEKKGKPMDVRQLA